VACLDAQVDTTTEVDISIGESGVSGDAAGTPGESTEKWNCN
jgi:hypothetical protein